MFISVDLPAPFSPSSACTSPVRRSKSTWSSATMPGKRFVIPRSSRTVSPLTGAIVGRKQKGAESPAPFSDVPSVPAPLLQEAGERRSRRHRHLHLAGDDLRLQRVHLGDERLRHARVDLADADTVVLEVEQQVAATLELALLRLLDGVEDPDVDPLQGAREDALREAVLVDVHADAPDLRVVGRAEHAEPAEAGDLELDLRALADLVLRDGLALVLRHEVLRVADQHLDLRVGELRAVLVAHDVVVDGRDLDPAHGADDLLAAVLLHHLAGQVADQAARLVRGV